jgi:hypothetical protein
VIGVAAACSNPPAVPQWRSLGELTMQWLKNRAFMEALAYLLILYVCICWLLLRADYVGLY